MQIGYIGLGKMGRNMVLRLLEHTISVVAWNRSPAVISDFKSQISHEPNSLSHFTAAETIENLVISLEKPRIIWLMLPAGNVVEDMVAQLATLLSSGDLIIDGGNSFYQDSIKHGEVLAKKGIHFMDVGVSGGPGGAREGASLMIGGDKDDYEKLTTLFQAIAAPQAYRYLGRLGAGHFAKMVHNGIEYGMMEAIGEGAAVLKQSPFQYRLSDVFSIYNNRTVIESRLINWAQEAFAEDENLTNLSTTIAASGEGQWTVNEAKKMEIDIPVIEKSLDVRLSSVQVKEHSPEAFRNKVVSALRGKFGGHAVRIKDKG